MLKSWKIFKAIRLGLGSGKFVLWLGFPVDWTEDTPAPQGSEVPAGEFSHCYFTPGKMRSRLQEI